MHEKSRANFTDWPAAGEAAPSARLDHALNLSYFSPHQEQKNGKTKNPTLI